MNYTSVLGLVLIGLAGCGSSHTSPGSTETVQSPTPPARLTASSNAPLGVDVSNYQGQLDAEDFQQIAAAGNAFVFIKATQGDTVFDADYGVEQPQLPQGWSTWTFWQHSQDGVVAGVDGNVDLNRFNGSTEQLSGLLVQSSR